MSDEAPKSHWLLNLITTVGLGGSSGAAVTYYVQEAHSKAIERLDREHEKLETLIYPELKEINTRLSRIEGKLEPK